MIIVTGASRGIGLAIAEHLISKGHEVLGLARNIEGLPFPAETCDVSNPQSVKGISASLAKKSTSITGLVNVAGIASMNLLLTSPPAQIQRLIDVNLVGTMLTTQAFAPFMIRERFGRIVNFSSIAVSLGIAGESSYAASKAGVESFTRTFAREVSKFGITVNCIAPGPIPTDLLRGLSDRKIWEIIRRQIIPRQFEATDICDVVELLFDQKAGPLTGMVFPIGGV